MFVVPRPADAHWATAEQGNILTPDFPNDAVRSLAPHPVQLHSLQAARVSEGIDFLSLSVSIDMQIRKLGRLKGRLRQGESSFAGF